MKEKETKKKRRGRGRRKKSRTIDDSWRGMEIKRGQVIIDGAGKEKA